jgi:hypothetical protein
MEEYEVQGGQVVIRIPIGYQIKVLRSGEGHGYVVIESKESKNGSSNTLQDSRMRPLFKHCAS